MAQVECPHCGAVNEIEDKLTWENEEGGSIVNVTVYCDECEQDMKGTTVKS